MWQLATLAGNEAIALNPLLKEVGKRIMKNRPILSKTSMKLKVEFLEENDDMKRNIEYLVTIALLEFFW